MTQVYSYLSNLRPGFAGSNIYRSQKKCEDTMLLEANVLVAQLKEKNDEYLVKIKNPNTNNVVVEVLELKDNELYTVEAWTMISHFLIEE